jgi:hypothetical protein
MRQVPVDRAPNKPNPGRGGFGNGDGLWIIDDLGRAYASSAPLAAENQRESV